MPAPAPATNEPIRFADPEELLRYLYADLTRLSQVASPRLVLHRYDGGAPLRGVAAAQAHEEALVAATGGTLRMDVERVTLEGPLGGVHGVMRARKPAGRPGAADLAARFYGLWRFEDGRPVEHFENIVGDAAEVAKWFEA
ncbi:hypothetical protein F5X98DRAFT_386718 [Xylaria grammica]|nr:hypothetical protein F5X98DRAFT_386718 [Xylaria grammica]